jgi:pyruvate formate lyase activating enzyme
MSSVTGQVFSIERYAIHDGPGIRTLVFFKGCPLRCVWCANPEGRSFEPELVYTPSLCIHCSSCLAACAAHALSWGGQHLEIARDACTLCGACVEGCYAEALEINSYRLSAQAVVDEVERDRIFYQVSGNGGVTLSGGEPLAQPTFALEILRLCKAKGLHTAIETCGHYPFGVLEQALPYLDLVFFDLKQMDAEAHRRCTGAGNELILANLEKLQAYDVEIRVRVPVIPTLTDSIENMEAIASHIQRLPQVSSVELLPYHRLGVNKYEKLGLEYAIEAVPTPDAQHMHKLAEIFVKHGIDCIIG